MLIANLAIRRLVLAVCALFPRFSLPKRRTERKGAAFRTSRYIAKANRICSGEERSTHLGFSVAELLLVTPTVKSLTVKSLNEGRHTAHELRR